jgi:hypothetical protein
MTARPRALRKFPRSVHSENWIFLAGGDRSEQCLSAHRAYVSGSIVFASSFQEASISEFFLEAEDSGTNTLEGLAPSQIETLAALWVETERPPILDEYQDALARCEMEKFDQGGRLFEDTEAFVMIRYASMHSKPEWSDELEAHKRLQFRLKDRFPLNALAAAGSLWFPHFCMGAVCA